MHVHGNHLNLSMPIETGAASKAAASRQAAEIRKKLMKGGTGSVSPSDFEDALENLGVEEQTGEDAARRQQKPGQEGHQAARMKSAEHAKSEESLEERTSLWA